MKVKLYPLNNIYNRTLSAHIYYSRSTASNDNLPKPMFILSNLADKSKVLSNREVLSKRGGIYCFLNKINQKQYIVSAKDIYYRLNEHLYNRKSNSALQAAI